MNNVVKKLMRIVSNPNLYNREVLRNSFLLLRLYKHPEEIILDENPETYDMLILNNDFVKLINYGLNCENFRCQLSLQVLDEIHSILAAGIDAKECYEQDKEKQKPKNRIEKFILSNAVDLNRKIIKYIHEQEEENILRDSMLSNVEFHATNDEGKTFLEVCSTDVQYESALSVLRYLVLENKFTEIVSKLSNDDELNIKMIDSAIDILVLGIKIKNNKLTIHEYYLLEYINSNNIRTFDDIYAIEVVEMLKEKKLQIVTKRSSLLVRVK